MIVYLHNPSHESCERFVRETLLSYQMKQFLERNEILLWGVSVRSQEGYKGKRHSFALLSKSEFLNRNSQFQHKKCFSSDVQRYFNNDFKIFLIRYLR